MEVCVFECGTLSLVFPGRFLVRGCQLDRCRLRLSGVPRLTGWSRNYTTEARRHGESIGQRGHLLSGAKRVGESQPRDRVPRGLVPQCWLPFGEIETVLLNRSGALRPPARQLLKGSCGPSIGAPFAAAERAFHPLSHGKSSRPDPTLTLPSPCLRASVVKFSRLNFHDSFHPDRHLDASPIAALISEPKRLRLTIHRLLSARPGLHGGLLGQRHAHNQSPLRTRSLP